MKQKRLISPWLLAAVLLLAFMLAALDNFRHGRPPTIEERLIEEEIGKRT